MTLNYKNIPSTYIIFSFFVFLIIKCILRPIQGDTYQYFHHFLLAQDNIRNTEYSFFYLSKFCHFFVNNEQVSFRILISIYAILEAIILLEIFKESKYFVLSFILFYLSFYNWFMCTLMRASLAYLICFSGLYNISYNQKKIAYFKIIFASLIHISVCWFIIMPFLYKNIKNNRQLFQLIVLSVLCIIIISPILNTIFKTIQPNNYIYDKIYSYYTSSIYHLHPFSLKSVFLILILLFCLRKIDINNVSPICKLSLIFLSFSPFLHFFGVMIMGEIGSRLRDFIYVELIILCPEIIMYLKNKIDRLFFKYYVIFGFLFFSIKESNLILFFN